MKKSTCNIVNEYNNTNLAALANFLDLENESPRQMAFHVNTSELYFVGMLKIKIRNKNKK